MNGIILYFNHGEKGAIQTKGVQAIMSMKYFVTPKTK